MATGHRLILATEPKYYPADAAQDRTAFAKARLAEPQWSLDDRGNWVEGETLWHDGVFNGEAADRIREYQKGDRLLAIGNTKERTVERDGKIYKNPTLYVNHFSPDLTDRAVTVVMDRTQRKKVEREAAPATDQEAEQSASHTATPEYRHPEDSPLAASRPVVERELHDRLSQLVEAKHIRPDSAARVMQAFEESKTADPAAVRSAVYQAAQAERFAPAANAWIVSVPHNLSGGATPLTWVEAERATAAQTSPPEAVPAPAAIARPTM